MNTSPPAVASEPPLLIRPVLAPASPYISALPSGRRHRMSPLLPLTAIISPQGGWMQGMPFWSTSLI